MAIRLVATTPTLRSYHAIIARDVSNLLGDASMQQLKMNRAFTLIEPGPVVLVTLTTETKTTS